MRPTGSEDVFGSAGFHFPLTSPLVVESMMRSKAVNRKAVTASEVSGAARSGGCGGEWRSRRTLELCEVEASSTMGEWTRGDGPRVVLHGDAGSARWPWRRRGWGGRRRRWRGRGAAGMVEEGRAGVVTGKAWREKVEGARRVSLPRAWSWGQPWRARVEAVVGEGIDAYFIGEPVEGTKALVLRGLGGREEARSSGGRELVSELLQWRPVRAEGKRERERRG